MVRFAHLAVRSCYSLRDGVIRPDDLAPAVARMGMSAVGVADREGLYGIVRHAKACRSVGVRLVIGADLALQPTTRAGWGARPPGRPRTGQAWLDAAARVVVLAADRTGYANLARLVTAHHLESTRRAPHATWAQLSAHTLGCHVLMGDASPVARLSDAGLPDAAEAEARRWLELVGTSGLLIGVTHHLAPGDDARARARFALADRLGVRAVAHQEPRYLTPADARIADVMDAVRQQVPLDLRHTHRRNAEGYLKSPEEMARVFTERPDALAHAADVAEACQVDLGLGQLRVPDFLGDGPHAAVDLRRRAEAGLGERFETVTARHLARLDHELAVIEREGLAPYFLTVAEIVQLIRAKHIAVACRGSAAGSLVTYALRISDVDPIGHDLVFERFVNRHRAELPDIDIDVESARREEIYAELLTRYGEDRVACVMMVETFKARMAIREVGKAMGLPAGEIDVMAKAFPHVRARDVRTAMAHLPELAGRNLDRPDLALLFDVVERMDALPRHVALHPCGVLLGNAGLRDLVAMERSADRGAGSTARDGFAMAQVDKHDVEDLGLCKLDVLGVRMLSAMAHCVDEARRVRGREIELGEIGWGDDATYELIRSTRTLGMFQIESPGQRELLGRLQPDHLGDLVVDISLFRPGPVKGDMIRPFLARRHGVEGAPAQGEGVLDHPLLARALDETHGVIVYHEQVMRCLAAVTGCDLEEADQLRRRLADPDALPELEERVIGGALARGMDWPMAGRLWHALAQFGSFGFCKAHAAAFAVPTYRSAWLKAHVLPELVAGLATHDPGMYPRRLLLEDARQFGVALLPVDVVASDKAYRVARVPAVEALGRLGVDLDAAPTSWPHGWRRDATGGLVPPAGVDAGGDTGDEAWRWGIRLGLADVTGIDDAMIDSLLLARPFTDVGDVRRRARLSRPVAEALAHVGAFDALARVAEPGGPSRRDVLLEVTERWGGATARGARQGRASRAPASAQLSLLEPDGPPGLEEYRASERVRAELEVIGIDAAAHVVRFYEGLLERLGVTRAVDLLDRAEGQRIRIAGAKVATQTPPVRSGQRVIFLSLDDATGVGDATFFEAAHERCAATVFGSWLLVVEGVVHRSGARGVTLTADHAWDLRHLMRAWRHGSLASALSSPGVATELAEPPRKLWHASQGSAGA